MQTVSSPDRLVTDHLPYTEAVTQDLLSRTNLRDVIQRDDAVAYGHVGLLEAASRYERAHGKQHTTYVYTGDHPTAEEKRKIGHIIASAPADLTVVAAVSRTTRGAALAEEIAELAGQRPVERRTPEFGSRWADQMQIEQRHRSSLERLNRRPDHALENVRQAMANALDAGVHQAAIRTAIVRRPLRGRQGIER